MKWGERIWTGYGEPIDSFRKSRVGIEERDCASRQRRRLRSPRHSSHQQSNLFTSSSASNTELCSNALYSSLKYRVYCWDVFTCVCLIGASNPLNSIIHTLCSHRLFITHTTLLVYIVFQRWRCCSRCRIELPGCCTTWRHSIGGLKARLAKQSSARDEHSTSVLG